MLPIISKKHHGIRFSCLARKPSVKTRTSDVALPPFRYNVVQLQPDFGIFAAKCRTEGIANQPEAHTPLFQPVYIHTSAGCRTYIRLLGRVSLLVCNLFSCMHGSGKEKSNYPRKGKGKMERERKRKELKKEKQRN